MEVVKHLIVNYSCRNYLESFQAGLQELGIDTEMRATRRGPTPDRSFSVDLDELGELTPDASSSATEKNGGPER